MDGGVVPQSLDVQIQEYTYPLWRLLAFPVHHVPILFHQMELSIDFMSNSLFSMD